MQAGISLPSRAGLTQRSHSLVPAPEGERFAYACGYVREQRKQDGRTGAPTEPFVCLRFATNASHEGERPMAWLPGCCLAVQRR